MRSLAAEKAVDMDNTRKVEIRSMSKDLVGRVQASQCFLNMPLIDIFPSNFGGEQPHFKATVTSPYYDTAS